MRSVDVKKKKVKYDQFLCEGLDMMCSIKTTAREFKTIKSSRGRSSAPSLGLLVLGVGAPQGGAHAAPHLRVQQSAREDHGCAQPVPGGEGVLEVKDGEDEAEELPERHHQGDGERRALCGQDENPTDAHVPEEMVKDRSEAQR